MAIIKESKTCLKCGTNQRYKDGRCVSCAKTTAKKRHDADPEAHKARSQAWRAKNKDRHLEYSRQWREDHPGHYTEYHKEYRERNLEQITAYRAQWKKDNRDRVAASWNKRRFNEKAAGENYTAEEFRALRDYYGNMCLCCTRDDVKLTADHVVPVSKGGSNRITNIQLLCRSCNSKKKDKTIDYRPQYGPLLFE